MYKELERVAKVKNLYHLSLKNHDGEMFKPRVPQGGLIDEDTMMNRVCLSPTMSGAFRAVMTGDDACEELYVHVADNIDDIMKRGGIYKPSEYLVPDVYSTNEHWSRRPVRMKCIGKARFEASWRKAKFYNHPTLPKVRITWIEKY